MVEFKPRAIAVACLLAACTTGCWSEGVIPKEPAGADAKLAGKSDPCDSDSGCEDDLVCDGGRCIAWHTMKGQVPEIGIEELLPQVETGHAQILDVRTSLEFALGHAPGAVNVPIGKLDDLYQDLGNVLDKDRQVVVVCQTAHRSIAGVRLLQRHGWDVVQLHRGWREHRKIDGFPLETGRYEPTAGKHGPEDRKPQPPPERDLDGAGSTPTDPLSL